MNNSQWLDIALAREHAERHQRHERFDRFAQHALDDIEDDWDGRLARRHRFGAEIPPAPPVEWPTFGKRIAIGAALVTTMLVLCVLGLGLGLFGDSGGL